MAVKFSLQHFKLCQDHRLDQTFFLHVLFRLQEDPLATTVLRHHITTCGPGLGPQGQAAGRLVSGEVEHTVQCWAVARRRRWDGWPRAPQGCACNGERDRDKHPEDAARRTAGGARRARRRTRSRTKCCAVAFQRPPISEPSTSSFCGPPLASSGYVLCLRRSAAQPRPLPLQVSMWESPPPFYIIFWGLGRIGVYKMGGG